jgi:hypothetical protein
MPDNFIPEIVHARLLEEREKAAIAVKHCNMDYEGDIKAKGDKVKILTPGEVSLFSYSKNTDMSDPEILDDAEQFLEITESEAFQYYLDDVDKRQMDLVDKFMAATQQNAAYKLSDYADSFVFNKYTGAGKTVATYSSFTSANALALLADASKAMLEANVPEGEKKYFEISPQVYAKFVIAKILKDTDNSKTLETGRVGAMFGMDIYVSNNVVQSGTTSQCLLRTKKAIAFAEQINQSEKIRHPKRFGDIHRGLMLCGAKVVVPRELICFTVVTSAES